MAQDTLNPTKEKKQTTTQEIAKRLAELCREGKYEQAQTELFADNAESVEPESAAQQGWDVRTKGLDKIREKAEKWQSMVEQYHGGHVSEPLVAGNHIAMAIAMDVTMKGKPRNNFEELAVYEVRDGKIVKEEFFV